MTTLHLGVLDVPYTNEPSGKRPSKTSNSTTGDVAEILEAKYHVFEIFWQLHGQALADTMVESMAGGLESILMGAPVTIDPNGTAMAAIMQRFRDFLTNKEMDALGYPGVPTKAALTGVSHRFKDKKGAAGRPSFVDTGLYEASFKAWIEQNA